MPDLNDYYVCADCGAHVDTQCNIHEHVCPGSKDERISDLEDSTSDLEDRCVRLREALDVIAADTSEQGQSVFWVWAKKRGVRSWLGPRLVARAAVAEDDSE